jgi:hypothetical protein
MPGVVWRGVGIKDAASASDTIWEAGDPALPFSGSRFGLQRTSRQDLRAAMMMPL